MFFNGCKFCSRNSFAGCRYSFNKKSKYSSIYPVCMHTAAIRCTPICRRVCMAFAYESKLLKVWSLCNEALPLFAQVLWPALVPVSILMMEKDHSRRKMLVIPAVTGILISIYLLGCLIIFPVQAEIRTSHIHYQLNFTVASAWFSGVLYFIPTVLPFFISGVKKTLLWVLLFFHLTFLRSYILMKILFQYGVFLQPLPV